MTFLEWLVTPSPDHVATITLVRRVLLALFALSVSVLVILNVAPGWALLIVALAAITEVGRE